MRSDLPKVLEMLINKATNTISRVTHDISEDKPISYVKRNWLNETLEAIYLLSKKELLPPEDNIVIQRFFRAGEEIIHDKLIFFASYYYSKQKLIHSEVPEKEEYLRRTNVETASMLTRIRSFELSINNIGSSHDDNFVGRMPQLLDGISYVIDKNIEEVFMPVMYNLLNLYQTIYFYLQSKHKKYHNELISLQSRVTKLAKKIFTTERLASIRSSNFSLWLFFEQCRYYQCQLQGKEYQPRNSLEIDLSQFTLYQKLRIINSWAILDYTLYKKYIDQVIKDVEQQASLNPLEVALAIRAIIAYPDIETIKPVDINVLSYNKNIDFSSEMPKYFNKINEIGSISITPEEMTLLQSYNDETLRRKIAASITNIPINELEREMKKPHGGFEISDMELRVKVDSKSTYLCMPFKTGQEIKTNSVPVDILYQLLRPFNHFNNCAVVFITAKKCSQNLLNEIKRSKDKHGFSIEVIEDEQLAKLLKINGQLN